MWKKRDIVDQAYDEIGVAGWVYDLDPEEQDFALQRLDLLMGMWSASDIRVGYAFSVGPTDGDLDQDSGLDVIGAAAAIPALAINIAAAKGKQMPPSTMKWARDTMDALQAQLARMQIQRQPYTSTVPRGAGNRRPTGLNRPYMPSAPPEPLGNSSNDGLNFLGD